MLNKIFVAADTPQGSFDSGMATLLDKSSEGEAWACTLYVFTVERLKLKLTTFDIAHHIKD